MNASVTIHIYISLPLDARLEPKPARGTQIRDSLLSWLSAVPLQRGRADFQLRERPFEVEFKPKCGARRCPVGDLSRLLLSGVHRGERPEFSSIERESVPGQLGFNHEGVVAFHTRQPRALWPPPRRACAPRSSTSSLF